MPGGVFLCVVTWNKRGGWFSRRLYVALWGENNMVEKAENDLICSCVWKGLRKYWHRMTQREVTGAKVHKVPEIWWLWGNLLKRESTNLRNLDDPEQTCTITGQPGAPKACHISHLPTYHNQLRMESPRFSDLARLPRFSECKLFLPVFCLSASELTKGRNKQAHEENPETQRVTEPGTFSSATWLCYTHHSSTCNVIMLYASLLHLQRDYAIRITPPPATYLCYAL